MRSSRAGEYVPTEEAYTSAPTSAAAAASNTRRVPSTLTASSCAASRDGWISQARWMTASAPRNSSASGASTTSAATQRVRGTCSCGSRRAIPTISVTRASEASTLTTLVPTLPVAPVTTMRILMALPMRPGAQTGYASQTTREGDPMAVRSASEGILSDEKAPQREELIELLKKAYWMEVETVMSYIANSINPDGVRAQEIIESLQEDIQEELGHAQQYARRIKELYGVVPGSLDFTAEQSYLQAPEHQTDIVHVIKGVIEAETGAIEHYNRIIEFTDGLDFVTQDMVIAILHDEEGHRRLFEGYLREYEAEGLA